MTLENLNTSMINSRKLEHQGCGDAGGAGGELYDAEAAVDIETDEEEAEILKRNIDVAAIAVRRKDTYRIKEIYRYPETNRILRVSSGMRCVSGVTCRPIDGNIHLDGELMVFIIYAGEGEHTPVQWMGGKHPVFGGMWSWRRRMRR